MVSGMVNWPVKVPKSLVTMLRLISLPSRLTLIWSFLAGNPVPLTVTVERGVQLDGVTVMPGSTEKEKP